MGILLVVFGFFISALRVDWELFILEIALLFAMELVFREIGRVGMLSFWITEISLVFMVRSLLSMVVYWFYTIGFIFIEGVRIFLGNISGIFFFFVFKRVMVFSMVSFFFRRVELLLVSCVI